MSDSASLDLAQATAWFGVRPGMGRAEVLENLRGQAGVDLETPGDEYVTASTDHWEMDLCFSTDGAERLWQVALDSPILCWNGQSLHEARLDDALRAMEPLGPAMWTAQDVIDNPLPKVQDGPVSDVLLLSRGTLWLAERRLGIVVDDGKVVGVAWREPRDFPRQFAGGLTDEQRALSRRPDLADYLLEKRAERFLVPRKPDPLAPWRKLATVLFVAAVAAIISMGIRETLRWNEATVIQAKVVGLEQVPYKAFRDFLPPGLRWAIPRPAPRLVEGCRLAYLDPTGQPRELVVEEIEVNIYQHALGEEVPIAWLPGPPPAARSYTRARDAGIFDYAPWVIVLGFLYLAGLIASAVLPAVWRMARRKR
ncbi:MAG TPA: hypothetical protein VGO11_20680 [Chthoniobacteraceae bacterium]|jgi:hypothetical protein|nr:hypothetical protein [Chthoniobacteraceae bacterium]